MLLSRLPSRKEMWEGLVSSSYQVPGGHMIMLREGVFQSTNKQKYQVET